MQVAGFVLTGGRSSRMGRDKALLPYQGATLVEWVASRVRQAVGSVVLVGGVERYSQLAIPCISETYAGDGPLSGIEAALASPYARDWNLVVACDMPGLSTHMLQRLAAATVCEASVVAALGPASPGSDPRLEPLCAAYHVRLLPAVRQAISERKLKLINLLPEWKAVGVEAADSGTLSNINTSEDWAAWARTRP